jgi:hypothetical protein
MSECPICYREYSRELGILQDGICNSGYQTNCTHYICVDCCKKLSEYKNLKCPLCREDWSYWLESYKEDDEDDEDNEA